MSGIDERQDELRPADGGPVDGEPGVEPPDDSAVEAGRRIDPTTVVVALVVLACVIAAVILRYRYYRYVDPHPDSDEAENALLARELLRGEWPPLMRNQPYGGLVWTWFLAPSIKFLGMNNWGLRVPVNLLAVFNAAVVVGIGRALGWTWRRAVLAGAALLAYPLAAVAFGSRENMYFTPAVTGGLLALWLVLRSEQHRLPEQPLAGTAVQRRQLLLAGLFGGIGFWTNPGAAYLLFPTFLWLAYRAGRHAFDEVPRWRDRAVDVVRPLGLAAIGLLAGSLPYWYLTVLGDPRRDNYEGRVAEPAVDRLEFLGREILPGWLGFRVPYGSDVHGDFLGGLPWKVAFVALALLFAFQVVRRTHLRNESVLTVIALTVPLVYLLVSAKSGAIYTNLRYIYFASPILAMLMAAKWRTDLQAALAVAVLPVVALAGSLAWNSFVYPSLDPVIEALEARGTACVIGDYWAGGHKLMFQTEEGIVAVATYENRNPKYPDEAEELGNCAWLYRAGMQSAVALEQWMTAQGITFDTSTYPGYVVYFPDQRVWLDDVPEAAKAG